MSRGVCRGCGAELTWAKTKNGRSIPLEFATPATSGNVRIDKGVAVVSAHHGTGPYVAHFAKCPNAGQYRSADGGGR